MEQFNLEKYLINPSRKIVTKSGKPVRIICTDAKGKYPVIALISNKNGNEASFEFTKDGLWSADCENSLDLFFEPIKREGWVNVYRFLSGPYCGDVFETKEYAETLGKASDTYITTIKIEWEE